jgi:hypothetical protein
MAEEPHQPPAADETDAETDMVDLEHFDVHAWLEASTFEVREPELLGVPFN